MKAFIIILGISFLLTTVYTCSFFLNHDIAINIKDKKENYSVKAIYPESKSEKVQKFLNNYDRDNNLKINIESNPGTLSLQFNKLDNTPESLEKMKEISEGLKSVLTKND